MAPPMMSGFLRMLREIAGRLASPPTTRPTTRQSGRPASTDHRRRRSTGPAGTAATGGPGAPAVSTRPAFDYPGDFHGPLTPLYAPVPDGRPDPGEIVWTWVPFEEDYTQGKDRPVLLVGRDGRWLLALQLTSKDHGREAAQQRADGRRWVDIGSGPWDRQGRPSEVRVNRVIRVDPDRIRREGAMLSPEAFARVAAAMGT